MNAYSQPIARAVDQIGGENLEAVAAPIGTRHAFSVRITSRIEEVEAIWRRFSALGVDSPGQGYDFIRLWVQDRKIASTGQHYVVGEVDGVPVALLPLHLKRVYGIRVLTWFPGSNAGCYAPLADVNRLADLGASGRAALWQAMTRHLPSADLIYLRSIPTEIAGRTGLFDELGSAIETDTLYRAQFSSWAQCDSEQRSRSRRKHDRQQGDRLAALGAVAFEEISDPAQGHAVIDTMFRQRSERFRAQGIRDCFVEDKLIGFYQAALEPGSGVDVRLHVLRLDGEVVAVRYNIVHGDRMFCLISSMSDCSRIQTGSPGKQALLRVMQAVFDGGYSVFDMGAGFTDEKRHWCNVQIPLRQHYIGLSPLGALVIVAHRTFQRCRVWAKSTGTIKSRLRSVQQLRNRLFGKPRSDQL